MLKNISKNGLMVVALSLALGGCQTNYGHGDEYSAWPNPFLKAEYTADEAPSLIRTDTPPPRVFHRRELRDHYASETTQTAPTPTPVTEKLGFFASKPMKKPYKSDVETLVSRKIDDLSDDLFGVQKNVSDFSQRLSKLKRENEAEAHVYYTSVASISSDLQAGSTPGNPHLIDQWNQAQEKLNNLADTSGLLNDLSADIVNEASRAAYLLESTRATFNLSGAVKRDHDNLTALEDDVNQTIVRIDRLLNSVNDEMTRRNTYLRSERLNMQALSLAISNGELYGQSLSNQLFKRAASAGDVAPTPPPVADNTGALVGRRPLVIIRFDRPNVQYKQPVYTAISQVLERYPAARFDLVAVSPANGNAAQSALASTAARKNGEEVLRSLSSMGLPMERISLNAATSQTVRHGEVHLYVQ